MFTKIIQIVLIAALIIWLVFMLGCGDSPVSHQVKDSSDFMVITVTDIYENTKTYEAKEIRYDQKNIHHVENNRTKLQSCFYTGICEAVQDVDLFFYVYRYDCSISRIIICRDNGIRIWVKPLPFSANDGFYSLDAFNSFFYSICKKLKSDILSMRIIHFTKFIY